MNVLDENIPKQQRQLLESWRVHLRQIGVNIGWLGMQDEEIIPLLLKHRRITFFTRDSDFYKSELLHAKYCLVFLAIEKNETATFIRRFLRHPSFNTQTKRQGNILRVSRIGISALRVNAQRESHFAWQYELRGRV